MITVQFDISGAEDTGMLQLVSSLLGGAAVDDSLRNLEQLLHSDQFKQLKEICIGLKRELCPRHSKGWALFESLMQRKMPNFHGKPTLYVPL